jgi:hypothetical protein
MVLTEMMMPLESKGDTGTNGVDGINDAQEQRDTGTNGIDGISWYYWSKEMLEQMVLTR